MANIKNAAIREIIINRCLRHPGGRTVAQIMSACNKALDYHGYKLVTSENTIRADLLAISNRWHQVIDAKRIGRHIYYSYRDSDFSIFKHSLPEQYIIKGCTDCWINCRSMKDCRASAGWMTPMRC